MVDQPVTGQRVEPGREPGLRLVPPARVDHAQPQVLVQFVGRRRVAPRMPQEVAVRAALVTRVQGFERACIASSIRMHQRLVGGRVLDRDVGRSWATHAPRSIERGDRGGKRDAPASSALTRQRLQWQPRERGLLADLEELQES